MEVKFKLKNYLIECEKYFAVDQVVGVSLYEDFSLNGIGSTFRISIMVYHQQKEKLSTYKYYFTEERSFRKAECKLKSFKFSHRGNLKRNLCIFVNPISGKRMSREYFENILEPMLIFNDINYEMFETDSSTYIQTFFNNFNSLKNWFTEFIVIGGDGVFSQVLNSIMSHPDRDNLVKFPIGLMPGGSTNSLCCGISGKDPYLAALNIWKGSTIKGDIFKVNLKDSNKILYSTALSYGIPSDLVVESENLRGLFGMYRYQAIAVKKFLSPANIVYDSEIHYKTEENTVKSWPPSFISTQDSSSTTSSDTINIPRVNSYQTLSNCKEFISNTK